VPLWIKDLLDCRNHPSNEKNYNQQTPMMEMSPNSNSGSLPDLDKTDSDPKTKQQNHHSHPHRFPKSKFRFSPKFPTPSP